MVAVFTGFFLLDEGGGWNLSLLKTDICMHFFGLILSGNVSLNFLHRYRIMQNELKSVFCLSHANTGHYRQTFMNKVSSPDFLL